MAKRSSLIGSLEKIRFLHKNADLVRTLVKTTHFSRDEVESLILIHYGLTKDGPINKRRFDEVLYEIFDMTDDAMANMIFAVFSKGKGSHKYVNMSNWTKMMSIFLRGSFEERMKYAFQVYDSMGIGYLFRGELVSLLHNCLVRLPHGEDVKEAVEDLVEILLRKMDVDRDGKISYSDYETTVKKCPLMLEVLGPCFPSRKAIHTFLATYAPTVDKF